MSFGRESLADLEQQADAKRRELSASVAKVRLQLQPSNLSNEAAERLKSTASDVLRRASEKVNTRTGKGTAATGVALSALAIGWAMRGTPRSAKLEELPAVPQISHDLPSSMDLPSPTERSRDRNLMGAPATLVTALALGAIISRIVPLSRSEQKFLSSAGMEVRSACEQWAKRQVTQLAQPPLEGSLHPATAIALGIGLLLTRKDRK